MTRQVLIVVGVAFLSACGFGLILGLMWLVSQLVLGVFPYILASRFHAMLAVLPALFLVVAFVGAGCAASAIASRKKVARSKHDLSANPKSGA
jgi:hypothetical protein